MANKIRHTHLMKRGILENISFVHCNYLVENDREALFNYKCNRDV